MHLLVTGATGFIGQHLVRASIARSHRVTILARDAARANELFSDVEVQVIVHDMQSSGHLPPFEDLPDALLHLAWPGLPNYRDWFHLTENVPQSFRLIEQVVARGCRHVLVTGTCLEYGRREGLLRESDPCDPRLAYGYAKHVLHGALTRLAEERQTRLIWARLFYLFGPGQSGRTLLGQLAEAIDNQAAKFPMSAGDQQRDYSSVVDVAASLLRLVENEAAAGTFNVCSGTPIAVYDLARQYVQQRQAEIELVRGVYPLPEYEAFAFWGDRARLDHVLRGV